MAGAVSSSLSISHHLSHELEPAREGPALPSLLLSVMSGAGRRWCRMIRASLSLAGGSPKVLFALFQVLCQGQPWHQFAGCLAGMPRFLAGKVALQGQPRGQSVEMVAWCQPGMQVECLVTWSDAQPPAHQSLCPHRLLPAVEGCLSVCYTSVDRGWAGLRLCSVSELLSLQHSSSIR